MHARMTLDDLRDGLEKSRARLRHEDNELATISRRKSLAQQIGDAETVKVAEHFEAQVAERVAILRRKVEAQEAELALAEREVEEMKSQLKAAVSGVGSGLSPDTSPAAAVNDVLDDGRADLERELDSLKRAQHRSAAEAEADARLAELKRRMGK